GAGTDPTPDSRSFTVDTIAPAVTARTPAPGDNDVAFGATVTATFSEPLAPATLTTSTFTLTRSGSAVAAAVAWNAGTSTATLTPSAALAPSATYVATVVGGSGGVADPA